MFINM